MATNEKQVIAVLDPVSGGIWWGLFSFETQKVRMMSKSKSLDSFISGICEWKLQQLGPGYRLVAVIVCENESGDSPSRSLDIEFRFDRIDPPNTETAQVPTPKNPNNPERYKFDFSKGPIVTELEPGDQLEERVEKRPDCYVPANLRVFTKPLDEGVGLGIDCDGMSYRFKIPLMEMRNLARGIVSHAAEVEEILATRLQRTTARRLAVLCDASTARDIIVEYDDAFSRGLVKGPGAIVVRIQTGTWPPAHFRSAREILNAADAAKFYHDHRDGQSPS